MKEIREIRSELWHSLDMAFVKMLLFWTAVFSTIIFVMTFLFSGGMDLQEAAVFLIIMLAICVLPILIFCAWRTFRTFQSAESYIFCTATLSNPMGGRLRDTIKFRVLLEDAEGYKFVADTHSIFSTHKDFMGLGFEDYVNRNAMIAYNEETGYVVVIG